MANPPRGAQSSELEKLAEKFRKDPTSKLFFPLAEEYLKIGLIDDAIALLRQGRKAHPDLLSARVALGKALLQKGLQAEAQAEFEQVILANPDNLMAQKKLAGLYLHGKNKTAARASCEAVLAINPADSEVRRILDEVNRLPDPTPEDAMANEPTVIGSVADEATVVDTAIIDEPTVVEPTMVSTNLVEEPTVVGTRIVEPTAMESAVAPLIATEAVVPPADQAGHDRVVDDVRAAGHDPTAILDLPRSGEDDLSIMDLPPEPPVEPPADALATISLADLYVVQGHYHEAIEIYQKILAREPDHGEALIKLENASTLALLLQPARPTGEALRTDVVERVLGRPALQVERHENEAVKVGSTGGGSRHAVVIDRLEAWLAKIERRKRA